MSKPPVLIFTHAPWERPGRILNALETFGLDSEEMSIISNPKADLPDVGDISGLVLMGGPMSADDYENYPGLETEGKYAKKAIDAGKPVLGVCLGHQIIALALGGKLKQKKTPEIGFGTITRLDSTDDFLPMWGKKATVLHWHRDCVSLPDGGTALAKSDMTKLQAFRYGSALGLQFHLEVDTPLFEAWLSEKEMTKDLKKSQIEQLREEFPEDNSLIKPFAAAVFEGFAARCATDVRGIQEAAAASDPPAPAIVIS